jgi:hypothetical protein
LELKVESRCTVGLFGNNKEENGRKRSLNNVHMYKQKANFDDIQHETSMECAYKFQIRLALLEILDSDSERTSKSWIMMMGRRGEKNFASPSSVWLYEEFTRSDSRDMSIKTLYVSDECLKIDN